jgi:biofilm protein TabA
LFAARTATGPRSAVHEPRIHRYDRCREKKNHSQETRTALPDRAADAHVILAALEDAARYEHLHPAFARAFAFLRSPGLARLPPGRHAIDGDRLRVSIDAVEGRGRGAARLEVHRAHIDIQLTLEGVEHIGWLPVSRCARPAGPFDPGADIGFFDDAPETWIVVPPGHVAVFDPHDAHAPLGGTGRLRKAIVKVAV